MAINNFLFIESKFCILMSTENEVACVHVYLSNTIKLKPTKTIG